MSAQIELIRPDKGLSSLRRTKWIRKDDEKAAFVEKVFEPGTRKSKVYFDRMNRRKSYLELLSLLCASAADLDHASGPAAFFPRSMAHSKPDAPAPMIPVPWLIPVQELW
jgi:hypothetical protein